MGRDPCGRRKPGAPGNRSGVSNGEKHLTLIRKGFKDGFLSAILLETDSSNAPYPPKMHPVFQKCTRLSAKCTLLFWKCTLKNQKCTRAFSLGAFFYQNRCTKPTERQGYVPTQIIEKREILTVRVSLSHFYPTLIRQLPSHFCFKTLLWVLAQPPSFFVHFLCSGNFPKKYKKFPKSYEIGNFWYG